MNHELPDVQGGFRKGRGSRHQTANICWIIEKAKSSRKTCTLALLTKTKPLTGSQQIVGNSSRDGNNRPPDLPPDKSVCRSRGNNYNWTWNNRLVPNRERSMSRLHIVTLII